MELNVELLTVAAVARRIGVAPATLRTWDRRYGLGPSSHEAGEHRRYCAADVAKVTMMRRLISAGVAPKDAAERARLHDGTVDIAAITQTFQVRADVVDSLLRAANILDKSFVEEVLRQEIKKFGVVVAWTEVIVPLLFLVGEEWALTGKGIEVEHMLSEIIKRILRETTGDVKTPVNVQPVVLAAVGEELHSLALHALAAALAEKNIESFFLGARTPVEAVTTMMKRAAPPAVFLWAQLSENGDAQYLQGLPAVRPAPRVIIGGPGWDKASCTDVVFAQDLTHACQEIERAVGL